MLRTIAARLLPPQIGTRKKRGFCIPMPEVLKSDEGRLRDCLMSRDSVARRFFSTRRIERLMSFRATAYSPIQKEKEFLCWRLCLLELWKRHYGVAL